MSQLLIITTLLPELPVQLTINADLEQTRNDLALEARGITITSAEANDRAAIACRSIRQHLKLVETGRKEFVEPLRRASELSKAACDDHIKPLQEELARLEAQAGTWVVKERERVAAENEANRLALEKAENERKEAELKAQKAAARAVTPAGDAVAVKAVEKANDAIVKVQTILAAPAPTVSRAKGQSVKKMLKWELVDKTAAFAARPELFSVEIKPSAVQAVCVPEMPVPGLKLWWEEKVSFTTR